MSSSSSEPITPPTLPVPAPGSDEELDVLNWAEDAAIGNLKDRSAVLAMLRREASTTLTVLLAGVGGTLSYAAKMFEPAAAGPVAFGASVVCCYFVLLAVFVVAKCMLIRDVPSVYNEPKNLAQRGKSLARLKRAEVVKNMQEKIEDLYTINNEVSDSLNIARVLTALSPVLFALAANAYTPKTPPPQAPPLVLHCKTLAQNSESAPQLACKLAP